MYIVYIRHRHNLQVIECRVIDASLRQISCDSWVGQKNELGEVGNEKPSFDAVLNRVYLCRKTIKIWQPMLKLQSKMSGKIFWDSRCNCTIIEPWIRIGCGYLRKKTVSAHLCWLEFYLQAGVPAIGPYHSIIPTTHDLCPSLLIALDQQLHKLWCIL